MNHSKLAHSLRSHRPQAIVPLYRERFLAFVSRAEKVEQEPKHEKKADFGDIDLSALKPPPQAYVVNGIGIIPVFGVIGKGLSDAEKCLGCADIDDIYNQLREWETDASINEVVLHFNSGGGTTSGLEELNAYISKYPKFTTAFADEDCGSAAYWLASACRRFVVTPSANIGSIGIYISITDESAKFAAEGKKVIVVSAGDYKGAGIEGTSLSEKQMAYLQGEVNELRRRFVRDVLKNRPLVSEEDMQGQSFYGDIAAEKGLVTGVVLSFDELLSQLAA